MAKVNEHWTVGPHGPLVEIDDRLLTVEGEIVMPLGNFPRRMTVVGMTGKRTAIWSAIPLREPEMARIEALGAPAFLIVPGVAHRLDLKAWKLRYPGALVVAAPGAREAVEDICPLDATGDAIDERGIVFEIVPGIKEKESAMRVSRPGGTSLLINDILANVRHPHGAGAQIMARLFGFGVNRPQVPRVGKWFFVKDKAALATRFREWAAIPDLRRIIVSHGDPIEENPTVVLLRIADELSRR